MASFACSVYSANYQTRDADNRTVRNDAQHDARIQRRATYASTLLNASQCQSDKSRANRKAVHT